MIVSKKSFTMSVDFTHSIFDNSLFTRGHVDDLIVLSVHVDDMVIDIPNSTYLLSQLKACWHSISS